ncbi:MAG: UDP-N-acetylmuramoyl-tripeptide--D-alanyl-D-alanine ligase [Clostridia bacterium]|nr:UDP-N-acetylmuramoyl-tripeptide--D-alanyl-D-alanine ligase [Clostridia bacterium]
MRIRLTLPLTLKEIANAIEAPLYSHDRTVNAITTNSNEVSDGDLFIALKGENFDGNAFVSEANRRGGIALTEIYDGYNLTVKSVTDAFLKIAAYYKSKLTRLEKTVAVTGSVGKTTTKNILKEMLASKYKVHATSENLNNIIGVCITVLTAPQDTEILVIEMGMNHFGELSELSRAIMPNIAVITNVGTAHVGNLGSREMIAKAKLEISDGMSDSGIMIIPYGESLLYTKNNSFTVSTTDKEAFCYLKVTDKSHLHTKFSAFIDGGKIFEATLKLPGEHVAMAVAFSVAICLIVGIDRDFIKRAAEALDARCMRGKFIDIGNWRIFDDTYSSSPEAVISDFKLLSLHSSKRSCVLGDMLELGAHTEELHKKIGAAAYEYGFRHIYAFGVYAPFIAAGATGAGMARERISVNTDPTAPHITAEQIKKHGVAEEIILVKASHALHAERIYDYLK